VKRLDSDIDSSDSDFAVYQQHIVCVYQLYFITYIIDFEARVDELT